MEFDQFLREVCHPLELDWRKYRRRAAKKRIVQRLRELGLEGYTPYKKMLQEETNESAGLADRMRITVSRFFRERECWEELSRTVLPGLLEGKGRGETVRIWSAGCCGGEEPYTLAVIMLEQSREVNDSRKTHVMATDIDDASLTRAGRAAYDRASVREVPGDFLRRYFLEDGNIRHPVKRVVDLVSFSRHNLMDDPVPEGMDLVCCRYLAFTYYLGRRRRKAACRLYEALNPGGILMVGKKEKGVDRDLFQPLPGQRTGVFFQKAASSPPE